MLTLRIVAASVVCSVLFPVSGAAQPSWHDTLAFTGGRFGEMSALLEKTIFRVDVLVLRLRVDSAAAAKIALLADTPASSGDDSILNIAITAHDVLADIRFLREVKLSQFLDGIDEDMKRAVRADLLEESSYREIIAGLPESFSFLETRRIQRGDRISYRLHGDTLRTVFRDSVGTVLLDQIDSGPQRRRSVIATFLAPGSSFRKTLLRSIRDEAN